MWNRLTKHNNKKWFLRASGKPSSPFRFTNKGQRRKKRPHKEHDSSSEIKHGMAGARTVWAKHDEAGVFDIAKQQGALCDQWIFYALFQSWTTFKHGIFTNAYITVLAPNFDPKTAVFEKHAHYELRKLLPFDAELQKAHGGLHFHGYGSCVIN